MLKLDSQNSLTEKEMSEVIITYAITNCRLHQLGCNCRVHSARDGSNNVVGRSDETANSGNLLIDEVGHGPVLLSTANANEVSEQICSSGGVLHFWMPLNGKDWLVLVGDTSERRVSSSLLNIQVSN